jgi:hypothetical protein
MSGKKGMKMTNITDEDRERRRGTLTVTNEDVLKGSIPAPSPEKIHNMLFNVGGRPKCFESPEDMARGIEDYFMSLTVPVFDERGVQVGTRWAGKPTIGGLAVHLACDRRTINEYTKSDEFSPLIKRAKDIIHAFNEQMLVDGRNPVGAINYLVNIREGWVSDQRNIKIEPVMPDVGAKSTDEIAAFLDDKALPEG